MWDVLSFSRIGNARRRKQEEIKDVHRCPPLRGDIIWAHVTDFLLAFSVSYFECYCSVVQTQSMADPLLICLENSHVHIQKQVCDCVCARWRRTTARENQSAQNSHTFTLLTHTSSHTHTHTARSHTHTRHHTHTHTQFDHRKWTITDDLVRHTHSEVIRSLYSVVSLGWKSLQDFLSLISQHNRSVLMWHQLFLCSSVRCGFT